MDTKIKKRINGENKFRKYNNGVLTYKDIENQAK